jgi:hypothetical protein
MNSSQFSNRGFTAARGSAGAHLPGPTPACRVTQQTNESESSAMKIKSVLVVVRLAIVVLVAGPQQGYCPVVGYFNVAVTNGYNLIANPLDQPPDNSITNVISSPPDGTKVYLWDVPTQVFQPPSTYSNGNWDVNLELPPGRGFVLYANIGSTITFL